MRQDGECLPCGIRVGGFVVLDDAAHARRGAAGAFGLAPKLEQLFAVLSERVQPIMAPASATQFGRLIRSVMFGVTFSVHDSGTVAGLKHTLSSHA